MMTEHGTAGRTVDREVTIGAPVEAVWKALTDADELVRWFPMEARVAPGAGGSIWLMWEQQYEAESRITVWDPGRHLQFEFPHEGTVRLATDYYLQGAGGSTVLRVVTSGFGPGADWDAMVGGVSRGWDFELQGLKHYLERHRGVRRLVAFAQAAYAAPHVNAWRQLAGPRGWLGEAGLGDARVGGAYRARMATGDDIAGRVIVWDPPRQFVGTVEGLNDAFLRVELLDGADGGKVVLWLATYGVPQNDVRAIEARWREQLGPFLAGP